MNDEVTKRVKELVEQLGIILNEDDDKIADWIASGYLEISTIDVSPRTPSEIKKDIKHEKNPMRLKQLYKELNEAYKSNLTKEIRKVPVLTFHNEKDT